MVPMTPPSIFVPCRCALAWPAAISEYGHHRLADFVTAPGTDLGQRVRDVINGIGTVWSFQLTTIDGRPLTVGKVVTAILILLVGAAIARFAMRRIARRVLARVGIEPGAAAAFEALGFYVVMACLVVFALWVSEIPLTVFTLAGGALAIGVGFGSQKILNNFISGLIIRAERPIKIGDLIEVDGTIGEVENIGARSTLIKSFDNIHIVVPNSTFLESNVINWTHSDNLVRIRLKVGVTYGSPTRQVEDLICQAIGEHEKVITPPEPHVLFDDFGDSALVFEAMFWIKMFRPMDRRRVLSDLRFRIDELFRENDIVIAFPQRDVHIDGVGPVEVRLVDPETG
jgi:small-conductance mechanosensitive channel